MKKVLLIIVSLGIGLNVFGQQDPQYTQFMFNKQLYNPAVVGFDGKHCATLLARTQYTNYEDQTYTFNDDVNNQDIELFSSRGARTMTFSYGAPIPFARLPKGNNSGGIGVSVLSDKAGYLGTTTFKLDGAFRTTLASGAGLGFGLNIAATQKAIDLDGLRYKDPGDPRIPAQDNSGINPNVGLGVWYSDPNTGLSLGYALQNVMGNEFDFATLQTLKPGWHQYINVGYDNLPLPIPVDANLMVKASQDQFGFANPDFNLNALAEVTPDLELGIAFRSSLRTFESLALLLGYNLNNNLRIGYSFDLNTAKLRNNNNNTHEVVLNYCFNLEIPERPPIRLVDPRHLDKDSGVE
jgi:type IX secretion system PorP/SprF family membrane protein